MAAMADQEETFTFKLCAARLPCTSWLAGVKSKLERGKMAWGAVAVDRRERMSALRFL